MVSPAMISKGRDTSRLEYCIEDPTYQGAKMYAQGEDNERLSSRPVPARTSERGFSLWAVKFKRKEPPQTTPKGKNGPRQLRDHLRE